MAQPFVISRLLDAAPALAWDVYTLPEHLARWFGPKGSTVVKSEMDFRPGGRWHYGLSFLGAPMWGLWEFVEIEAPGRLSLLHGFSDEAGGWARHPMAPVWPLRTSGLAIFTPQEGRTLLTLQSQPHEATAAEQAVFDASHAAMTAGWSGSFDALDAYLKMLPAAGGGAGPAA